MPVQTSYPGVYIQEKSSGVRAINGVPTSITAFIGKATRGPVDTPVRFNTYGEFTRTFGVPLDEDTLGVAVRNYFDNGGADAIVVRIVDKASATAATVTANNLTLTANSPGAWGKQLRFRVESVGATDLFNLFIYDGSTQQRESFIGVSLSKKPERSLKNLLRSSSLLADAANPTALPNAHSVVANPGDDPFAADAPAGSFTRFTGGSDGNDLGATDYVPATGPDGFSGIYALLKTDIFNVLCIPPPKVTAGAFTDLPAGLAAAAAKLCFDRRAMLLLDAKVGFNLQTSPLENSFNGISDPFARNVAVYYPPVKLAAAKDPDQPYSPLGAIAGVYSRTDAERGVWKAPAGIDAGLNGISDLTEKLTDLQQGRLNPLAVNCLRSFPAASNVVWGARTLQGIDQRTDTDHKYVPVRRLTLFIEESLYRGTQWVVFEPNDEPLWSQIRLNVGSFMNQLFRQGALQGRTAAEAYVVKCDKETTTPADINNGVVNILVAFAPLKPAEFVIITIQQLAGQLAV